MQYSAKEPSLRRGVYGQIEHRSGLNCSIDDPPDLSARLLEHEKIIGARK